MKKFLLFYLIIFSRIIFSQVDTIPPITPRNVQAFGYERHIDLVWWDNEETDLAGYKVYRKMNNQWYYWTTVSKEKTYLTLNNLPLNYTLILKVSAFDQSGNESPLSDSVIATTHLMSDEEFLDMVQRATFRYFWDYAHPVSGLARERLGSGETVTIGGSGFGIMALLVGAERGFKSRELVAKRILKILNFLTTKAQRFHGAYSHWLNGTTGTVIPFTQYDDGGDLVETSFLLQGLLAARQYFNQNDSIEIEIRNKINYIWQTVEYNWYRRSPYSTYLYWHWSPNYGWIMNFKLMGWNETMICYILGIASPTHSIPASTYYQGWASSSNYYNERIVYGYKLFVGDNFGGPLFFTHYSFLGFDPRNKKDNYCNYYVHNRNQTLVNRAYCINNPKGFIGYDSLNWGLTASDNPWGYLAHEPYFNDNGTIAPTAALSSMPYTPNESIASLKYFYRNYYNQLWGEYGFKDAYNLTQNWFANSYLAIDQGPIIVMIENYRTNLLWNLFMSNPEIQAALDSIGFVYDSTQTAVELNNFHFANSICLRNYPNPFNQQTEIEFEINQLDRVKISVYDLLGNEVEVIRNEIFEPGKYKMRWSPSKNISSSIYFLVAQTSNRKVVNKIILIK